MNRGRMIVLVMAVACAGLAMMLMKSMVKSPRTKVVNREVSKIHVLVAKTDIVLGGRLKSQDLKWQPWPGSGAKGYITRRGKPKAIGEFTGSVAREPIGAGDPIRASKLVKANQGGVMAAILEKGKRAMSIKISKAAGVSGLILPNDRVDVILTTKVKGPNGKVAASETLLRNIRVLAIGTAFKTKKSQKSAKGKTATLALAPNQVEIITQARARGQLSLSLRALADATEIYTGDKKQVVGSTSVRMLKFGVASQAFGVE
ncbi:MAG: Flp pilus assembly protein CpaB [Hyphomicrobiaceae bacterium]|nr:Flp pilus assembly protein CpaB [Hyphomicrobiaceae bacterium]